MFGPLDYEGSADISDTTFIHHHLL